MIEKVSTTELKAQSDRICLRAEVVAGLGVWVNIFDTAQGLSIDLKSLRQVREVSSLLVMMADEAERLGATLV